MTSTTARRAVVRGRVQGVSFRDGARREADRLGVRGWVRNLDDGTVELHAEGDGRAVDTLLAWCGDGPRGARVEQVDARDAAPEGHSGFAVR